METGTRAGSRPLSSLLEVQPYSPSIPSPPHPHLAPVFIGLIGLVKPEASQLTNLQHQSESCQETELPPDDSPEET